MHMFEEDNCATSDADLVECSNWPYENRDKIPPLIRYMPTDYYNIRSLEKGTLCLSEIGRMNDVFEGFSGAIIEKTRNNIDMISDMAYLKSFTENGDDLMMWGTYSDS